VGIIITHATPGGREETTSVMQERYRPDIDGLRAIAVFERPFGQGSGPNVWLIGDSQAADFFNVLMESGRTEHANVRTLEVDMQCQSLISMEREQFDALNAIDREACRKAYDVLRQRTDLSSIDEVILAFNWDQRGLPFIGRATTVLHARGARQIFVVGRKSQGLSGPDILLQRGIAPDPDLDAYSARHTNPISWKSNASIRAMKHEGFTSPREVRGIWVDDSQRGACSPSEAAPVRPG
jgi:hypothetical protein